MNDRISVIIPCYNVEKYVARCLESVLSQTHDNLEAIVVNDGSTDGTARIVGRYLSDGRVMYLEQANAGVSAARNAGIDAASGALLAFADSDDYLETRMYERLLAARARENADMAVCNYNLVYDDRVEPQYSKPRNETVDVRADVYDYFARFCACPKPNNYIWTRLYRAEIVKNSRVRFENHKLGDDTLFNFKLLPHLRRVAFVPDGLYNYFQRADSNVYTVARKHDLAGVYADAFDSLAEYYETEGFAEFTGILPIHAFTRLRSVFFYSRLAGMRDEEIAENVRAGFKDREIARYLTGAAG
jgi:glycosyltransferase involved in cell wall biosynthesis